MGLLLLSQFIEGADEINGSGDVVGDVVRDVVVGSPESDVG